MSELSNCPFCGGEVHWCDCGSESDENTGCHQITCPQCGNFDFANGVNDDGDETLDELRGCMMDKFNKRVKIQ